MSFFHWIKKFINQHNNESDSSDTMIPISTHVERNIQEILDSLGHSSDIIVRRFYLGKENKISAALIYTDGLVNNAYINDFLKTLLAKFPNSSSPIDSLGTVKNHLLNVGEVKEYKEKEQIINQILTGSTIIFIENSNIALAANTKGWETRGVNQPENQLVLRGPREGFTENIRTNTSLIRRIVKTSKLRLEQVTVGTLTETTIGIMYIEGLAHKKIVDEVKKRLSDIESDALLGSGFIGDLIQDSPWSFFPQVSYTERPDTASGQLLEGKVIIIVDGSPFVVTVPVTFWMFLHSADDYYLEWQLSSLLRMLRMFTYFISLTLPSLYVAVTTFNTELLPTTLLVSLASQREGIPFPAFIEALIMEITFEILREAGVRMPRAIGQAVSIVGALVLGTAAVEAGIVSPAMVIIVSMTAISSFTAPYLELANTARILRFFLLVLAASFGLFGILFGLMAIGIHLTSLRSFGIPYMEGIAPFNFSDQKDLLIRVPWFDMKKRPRLFAQQNPVRQGDNHPDKPRPRQRQPRGSDKNED